MRNKRASALIFGTNNCMLKKPSMFIGLAWGFIKFQNLKKIFHACVETWVGFFFTKPKKKSWKKKPSMLIRHIWLFFLRFFFFRWKINPSMFMGHVRIFTLHWKIRRNLRICLISGFFGSYSSGVSIFTVWRIRKSPFRRAYGLCSIEILVGLTWRSQYNLNPIVLST